MIEFAREDHRIYMAGDASTIAASESNDVDDFSALASEVLRSVENVEALILDLKDSQPPTTPKYSILDGFRRSRSLHHEKDTKEALDMLGSITEHAQMAPLYVSTSGDIPQKEAILTDPLESISR
jgi:hypothetical protein